MSKIQRQKQGMVVEGYPDMKRLPRAYRHSENKLKAAIWLLTMTLLCFIKI